MNRRWTTVGMLLILAAAPALGQGYGGATLDPVTFPTLKPKRKTPAPPRASLQKLREIPVQGPLAGPLQVDGLRVLVPTENGVLAVDLSGDEPVIEQLDTPMPETADRGGWILAGKKNRYRYRTEPEGRIVAQKRPTSRSGVWKLRWQLRAPGSTPAPPLLVGKSILFGCTDNRVYALKARNGHRLWHQDLGSRILFPLVHWRNRLGPLEHDLVLVVPHPGKSIRALDPFDGKSLARFRLEGEDGQDLEDEFVAHAVVLADGRIVLPVQKYRPEDGALLVLGFALAGGKADESGGMPYNRDGPAAAGSR